MNPGISSLAYARPIDLARPIVGLPLLALLFAITYFEPLSVGGVKFAVLWRACLIIPAVVFLFFADRRDTPGAVALRPLAIAWMVYCLAPLGALLFGSTLAAEATQGLAQRFVPVIGVLLVLVTRAFLPADAVLRALPFYLCLVAPLILSGAIAPTGLQFSLDHLGAVSVGAYIGTFQNQHSAALAHAVGALVAWNLYSSRPAGTGVLYLLAGFGCLVLAALTTARSGLAGLFIGMFVIALRRSQLRLYMVPSVAVALVLIAIASIQPQYLELMFNRIMGKTLYQSDISLDSFTSGRLGLQAAGLQVFEGLPILDQVFGIGHRAETQKIGQITGVNLMAHNVFIDEMLRYGLVGLFGLLGVLYASLRVTLKNYTAGYPLGLALWLAAAVFSFFQSLDYSFQLLLVGLAIALDTVARDARDQQERAALTSAEY